MYNRKLHIRTTSRTSGEDSLDNLSKLFDQNFLAELTTEDTNDIILQSFAPGSSKTKPPKTPGTEGDAGKIKIPVVASMHKDIVNLAEECLSCTRYGKNAKFLNPKNASKPLPLLQQPGTKQQLDYAGPIENHNGKKIYLISAFHKTSKFPSENVSKMSSGKPTIKFLQLIRIHMASRNQFVWINCLDLRETHWTENNIEQKFCPVEDHRRCGLVERTIQTMKRKLGVILIEEKKRSIKLCLNTKICDLR